ncbi:YhgE/Pip family protein [Paenibacillus tarimensis]|uniref:YhgE/Pip family protein n=1 Tax=Paenibacillus tarimensis TaxID=416012 RepID=UPI001F43CC19|nr:YhgE/Pip domain-containing protein [Paenibacillus tarimensis]MCF2944521.1 YhgE/Pip domain-containing protein [Paenibacillus tarimensis]
MEKRSRTLFVEEWKSIFRKRMTLVSIIAVCTIPLLYSGTFLWAFWNPYDQVNELPVAVVNRDTGAEMDGKMLTIGEDFQEELKNSDAFQWDFVTKEQAEQGLRNKQYYMAIEIPEDFSLRASKVMEAHPDPAVLTYIPNEGLNYMTSRIGSSAVDKIKAELSQELTEAYVTSLFENIQTVSDGLGEAAEGAGKLADGSGKLHEGIEQIQSKLGEMFNGTGTLGNGILKLIQGTEKLGSGTKKLSEGSGKLSEGIVKLEDGHQELTDGVRSLQGGTAALKDGLAQSKAGAEQLKTGAEGLQALLAAIAGANPELAASQQYAQAIQISEQLSGGAAGLAEGQQQLAAGAEQLAAGGAEVLAGMETLGGKLDEAGKAAAKLEAGAQSVEQGAKELKTGLGELKTGIGKVTSGAKQLHEGTVELASGSRSVTDGSSELFHKLTDAAAETSSIHPDEATYRMFASPVIIDEEKEGAVPNYGTGMAPYFISMSLFVGAMMLTIVFDVRKPAVRPRRAINWFGSKLVTMLLVGLLQALLQALLLDGVMLGVLQLEVKSVPYFIGFSILLSWTYMAIVQMLVTLFGDAGRFLAILLLIVQLTTSGGTFPVEMIPTGLQQLHTWTPMAYAVDGFRTIISTGQFDFLQEDAGVLAGVFTASAFITLSYYVFRMRRRGGGQEIRNVEVAS